MTSKLILGSQSAQRRNLLQSLAGPCALQVIPPSSSDEPGFEGLRSISEIEQQLKNIVQLKSADVLAQIGQKSTAETCVVCADTTVVCQLAEQPVVLGKPPKTNWEPTVRHWFQDFYSGQTHEVWTGFEVTSGPHSHFEIVKAQVEFPVLDELWIDWYLSTQEPIGKAGGYGIQGHAAAFVTSISGSLTTIIGLPVWEVGQCLRRFAVLPAP